MLTKIDHKDIPDVGGRPRNEMRNFAFETLAEFARIAEIGDVMEVAGFPVLAEDESANVQKLMSAFDTEIRHAPECKGHIKRFRRKGRVFLEMEIPLEVKAARWKREREEAERLVAQETRKPPFN